ncbi:putative membrane metalloprotease ARASP2 chloroplastic [Dissostichus eleginoides]|uniref:Membrane metalloprotease ARASP2 chloroplastic n=1 Tax=Dissostichus eleginoides TaxID=100907 RepID=A0AAD9FKI6_DISEL|nr:putative membrane metalloprotease ARASP2 chloroplastic [Dissostichus eleginoides]
MAHAASQLKKNRGEVDVNALEDEKEKRKKIRRAASREQKRKDLSPSPLTFSPPEKSLCPWARAAECGPGLVAVELRKWAVSHGNPVVSKARRSESVKEPVIHQSHVQLAPLVQSICHSLCQPHESTESTWLGLSYEKDLWGEITKGGGELLVLSQLTAFCPSPLLPSLTLDIKITLTPTTTSSSSSRVNEGEEEKEGGGGRILRYYANGTLLIPLSGMDAYEVKIRIKEGEKEGAKVNMAVEEGVVFLTQVSSGFILTFETGLFNSEKLEMCCDLILF